MKPEILNWDGTKALRVVAPISDEAVTAIKNWDYDELVLLGHDNIDLSILRSVASKLKRLRIGGTGKCDSAGIYKLSNLRFLRLETAAKFEPTDQPFSFLNFPKLEESVIFWDRSYSRDIFQCDTLRSLKLFHYDGKTLTELTKLGSLRTLGLTQSKVTTLNGIESLTSIEDLDLYQLPNLADISSIRALPRLKSLTIGRTKNLELCSLLPLFEVSSLEVLSLGAGYELPNLEPFSKLKALRTFVTESQLLDQDFSILFGLKKLKTVRLIGLRNYKCSDDELITLAKTMGRKLTLKIIGRGKKEQTVIFELT